MKKMVFALVLVVALAVTLAACGGKSDSSSASSSAGSSASSGSNGGEITINASNFEFDQKEIHVKKGDKVKITLVNKEGAHGIAIPDFNVDLQQPGSAEFVADKTGTFEFHCSLMCGAGHADMKGTLIVE